MNRFILYSLFSRFPTQNTTSKKWSFQMCIYIYSAFSWFFTTSRWESLDLVSIVRLLSFSFCLGPEHHVNFEMSEEPSGNLPEYWSIRSICQIEWQRLCCKMCPRRCEMTVWLYGNKPRRISKGYQTSHQVVAVLDMWRSFRLSQSSPVPPYPTTFKSVRFIVCRQSCFHVSFC